LRSETLAAWEARLRPLLVRLPPPLAVRLYSWGRRRFLAAFERPPSLAFSPEGLDRTLWGIRFRSPILNAAGVFKNGTGYRVVAAQGGGGYLAGTTTATPRHGNRRRGVALPFAPYPRSRSASNWLGLPNPGHRVVAERLREVERVDGCPVGASVAACPGAASREEAVAGVAAGMRLYEEAGVDFLELNESCPNTGEERRDLGTRLSYLEDAFLTRRRRRLPVVVKFSCDTAVSEVPTLVGLLIDHGFDGVNFGNTSVDYPRRRQAIDPAEHPLFDHFTGTFGGGVSGRPIRATSLELAARAVEEARRRAPEREFHVVRTGGVEDAGDLRRSRAAGVALDQWYTGYFESFARHGHGLYRRLYQGLE
jgi:dihydroorotate dehydrogenase